MQNRESVPEIDRHTRAVVALDVGGTTIKSAVVGDDGALIGPVSTDPIDPGRSAKDLIDSLLTVVKKQITRAVFNRCKVLGVAMAFPGPFDYKRGISLIKGVGKYEALYGINLGNELRKRLSSSGKLPIVFEADSWAFAQGQYWKGAARGIERVIAISIGTGLGSAFLEKGRILQSERGIPEYSWIGNIAYGDGILDDTVSRRGIIKRYLSLARAHGQSGGLIDVEDLFNSAERGNTIAIQTFEETGYILGEALNVYLNEFRPGCVVIGGGISGAFDYLLPGLKRAIAREGECVWKTEIVKAVDIDSCTLGGVTLYFLSQKDELLGAQ